MPLKITHFWYAAFFTIALASQADTQVLLLKDGFEQWEHSSRIDIQCILSEAGLYQGAADGVYGPETEAALLAAYALIGSEEVRRVRGGLNNPREIYFFLYGFLDDRWGYEGFGAERRACLW